MPLEQNIGSFAGGMAQGLQIGQQFQRLQMQKKQMQQDYEAAMAAANAKKIEATRKKEEGQWTQVKNVLDAVQARAKTGKDQNAPPMTMSQVSMWGAEMLDKMSADNPYAKMWAAWLRKSGQGYAQDSMKLLSARSKVDQYFGPMLQKGDYTGLRIKIAQDLGKSELTVPGVSELVTNLDKQIATVEGTEKSIKEHGLKVRQENRLKMQQGLEGAKSKLMYEQETGTWQPAQTVEATAGPEKGMQRYTTPAGLSRELGKMKEVEPGAGEQPYMKLVSELENLKRTEQVKAEVDVWKERQKAGVKKPLTEPEIARIQSDVIKDFGLKTDALGKLIESQGPQRFELLRRWLLGQKPGKRGARKNWKDKLSPDDLRRLDSRLMAALRVPPELQASIEEVLLWDDMEALEMLLRAVDPNKWDTIQEYKPPM